MKYTSCSNVSSTLPAQTTINHCLNGVRLWVQWFIISQYEHLDSRRTAAKNRFFGPSRDDETRILVVDDNREVRDLLDALFKQCGFNVVMANNGLEALRKFNDEGSFHLVLTDICMPGINGNVLSKQIKKMSANIPVIAITASPGLAEHYFDVVLSKPFDLEYLLETVQNLLAENARHPSMAGLRQLKEKISNRKRN